MGKISSFITFHVMSFLLLASWSETTHKALHTRERESRWNNGIQYWLLHSRNSGISSFFIFLIPTSFWLNQSPELSNTLSNSLSHSYLIPKCMCIYTYIECNDDNDCFPSAPSRLNLPQISEDLLREKFLKIQNCTKFLL